MNRGLPLSELIFVVVLCATFGAASLARRYPASEASEGLGSYKLNKWLVGLSAGTTANSGFIVTAAVGLGYTEGWRWLLLPISWGIGDLVFWYFFPAKINDLGKQSRAATLSELLRYRLAGFYPKAITILSAVVILVCLTGYTSAQWIAGKKFLTGAFDLPANLSLIAFAGLIICYSSIGGFRGSVYTDTLQAFIRILGTAAALIAVFYFAWTDHAAYLANLRNIDDQFFNLLPTNTAVGLLGFVIGFAAAAIGFGLGQPQILSRYLAGKSPQETRSAWWIYIAFVQLTWCAMTLFGIVLRGVMPGIEDPEAGLSVFFIERLGAVATGLIAADVFATIASTSNGILVAMAQIVRYDLIPYLTSRKTDSISITWLTLTIGGVTMLVSTLIDETVVTLAISSVSMMGAAIAPAVMIKVLRCRHTGFSLLCTIIFGLLAATAWKYLGFGSVLNESAVGITVGLIANFVTSAATGALNR